MSGFFQKNHQRQLTSVGLVAILAFPSGCTMTKSAVVKKSIEEPLVEQTQCVVTDEPAVIPNLQFRGEDLFRQGKRFSFSWVEISIRDAMMELSAASGVPIVYGDEVEGMVSIEVKKKSLLETLEMLVLSGEYDLKLMGSYFYVGSTDLRRGYWRKVSHNFNYEVRYLKPTSLVKMVNPVYEKYVVADDQRRIVSVVAPRNIVVEIYNILSQLDRRPRQILLGLSITELSSGARNAVGRYSSDGSVLGALDALNPIQPAFSSTVLTREAYRGFLSSVQMLSREGLADIKAQPKIIVLDGSKASFNSDVKTLYVSQYSGSRQNKDFITTGITLNITPSITTDGEIILDINDAKSSDFVNPEDFQTNEHSIKTTVRVRPGQSLLLGGMRGKKKRTIVRKVPWLGDIPVVGWLFRSEDVTEDMSEVIFTIRPEIVCDEGDARAPKKSK